MYRQGAVSLRSKLSRLVLERPHPSAFAPAPVPREESAPPPSEGGAAPLGAQAEGSSRETTLADLRARMQAALERHARRAPAPPPLVDTTELPFVTTETPRGPLSIRTQRLSPAHRMGRAPILAARGASSRLLALLALDPSLAERDISRALYLDTETTGLHGGTGTVAFLVGLAFWEGDPGATGMGGGGGLVVEQILVRNLGEEEPMLAHVRDRIASASMLITFNGKSFDLPLLRTRFVMARLAPPEEPPHLDLVHVARRLHKPRGIECRLVSIERDVLGFVRENDVPSGEVSACYLHFLRTGEASAMLGVIEHNAWDVVAMAALVGLYGEPLEGTQLEAGDLVGVARTLQRARAVDEAWDCVERAVAAGGGDASLRARAELAKARGDRAKALADFEALSKGVDDPKVRLELAKLYEHFVRDHARALSALDGGTGEDDEAVARRRARLEAKREKARVAASAASAQGVIPGIPTGARSKRRVS
jgi:uncharacterized protein YprB with RNaseH-like and TPR domain